MNPHEIGFDNVVCCLLFVVWSLSSAIASGSEEQKYEFYKRLTLLYAVQSNCHKDDPSVSPNPSEIKIFWKDGSLSKERERYKTDQSARDELAVKYQKMMSNKMQARMACTYSSAFWTGVEFAVSAIEHDIL